MNIEREYYCTFEQLESYWAKHMTETTETTTTPPPPKASFSGPVPVCETKWQQSSEQETSALSSPLLLLQSLQKQKSAPAVDSCDDRCNVDRWISGHQQSMMGTKQVEEEEEEEEEERREPREILRGGKPKIIISGGDVVCPVDGGVAANAAAAAAI